MKKKENEEFIKRKSILENLDFHINRNLYCERKSITNEASVESFFCLPFLKDLGFKDNNIKPKESIDKLQIAKGHKKILYKPDYCIMINNEPKLIIDAKAPNENINAWIEQCAHYCLILNRNKKTIDYFLITNGIKTGIYKWENDQAILELNFEDFYIGNKKYEELRKIISMQAFISNIKDKDKDGDKKIILNKIDKETAQKLFINCHKYIWNTEKRGPLSAFTEFIKLIFLKLWNDRILHENYPSFSNLEIPSTANVFSVKWIESREKELLNPISDIHFKNLLEHIQDDIDINNKKRIFDINETIKLKPTTIKGIVKKLEKIDLFGIDEDLNGRLFETFLNSTMRGEALGQYFTPRSIVLLGVLIAELKVSEEHIDKVMDGSCGTGGFLIEAFTIMRNIVRENQSFTKEKKNELINKISSECLYGIDAASEPNLARIARINMYLHGDGGSHIYFADGLQKTIEIDKTDKRELQIEIQDMIDKIKLNSFDIILTNPPFSMWYEEKNETQLKILDEYELIKINGTNKKRNRLRGSAMFIERYVGLLKPKGKLISIIDDTVLSSEKYDYVRNFIRNNFIIKAIISLPGDAFQMAKARVKTSLIILEKKDKLNEEQPSIFMYSSIRLGIDDMPITTSPEKVKKARELANEEIKDIIKQYNRYKNGEKDYWLIDSERIKNRLDVKYCVPLLGRYVKKWENSGYDVKNLENLCYLRNNDVLNNKDNDDIKYKILTITYSGKCKTEEIKIGKDINLKKMKMVKTGDIVFSEYNACQGAIGYITDEFNGALASNSYIIVKCLNDCDSLYLWSILRTTEIKADLLTSAIGMGRQTICWDGIKTIKIPLVSEEERKNISIKIKESWEKEKQAQNIINNIFEELNEKLDVESESSLKRFLSNKPPK